MELFSEDRGGISLQKREAGVESHIEGLSLHHGSGKEIPEGRNES